MVESFSKGDVVMLKSGGPKMTINWLDGEGMGKVAHCQWFDNSDVIKSEVFGVSSLIKAEQSEDSN